MTIESSVTHIANRLKGLSYYNQLQSFLPITGHLFEYYTLVFIKYHGYDTSFIFVVVPNIFGIQWKRFCYFLTTNCGQILRRSHNFFQRLTAFSQFYNFMTDYNRDLYKIVARLSCVFTDKKIICTSENKLQITCTYIFTSAVLWIFLKMPNFKHYTGTLHYSVSLI